MTNPHIRGGGRLGAYTLGFFRQRGIGRILAAHGWDVCLGPISRNLNAIGVWGATPYAERSKRAAKRRGLRALYLEDVLYRSVGHGRDEPLIGLMADTRAPYFEAREETDLSVLLNIPPGAVRDDTEHLVNFIRREHLSKYNPPERAAPNLPEGYVLVVDQVPGDASIAAGHASAASFCEMLDAARDEHPGQPIFIRQHPRGGAHGHFGDADFGSNVHRMPPGVSASLALAEADAVYAVTSQMGFEAILAGQTPRLFGMPFYGGWGLSDDVVAAPERTVNHSALSLAQAVLQDYPLWYDVYRDQTCDALTALQGLSARRRAAEVSETPRIALGVRRWKRPHFRQFFGQMRYLDDARAAPSEAKRLGANVAVWASQEKPGLGMTCEDAGVPLERIEDGFLRSLGLGAALHPPLSLALDQRGIYYNPAQDSDLEHLIAASTDLAPDALLRARALRQQLIDGALSKYNVGDARVLEPPSKPERRVLVPGQVEDDASIIAATTKVRTNAALLREVRDENPDAVILYKPHPDVEAGLRAGALTAAEAGLADIILRDVTAPAAIATVDEVWTMTSLIGFEALLRDRVVVVLGCPFYAGWGLTDDRGDVPERRRARPSLDGLVHAALIDYPMYRDPVSGLAAPVEVIVERLSNGIAPQGTWRRGLAGLQRLTRR